MRAAERWRRRLQRSWWQPGVDGLAQALRPLSWLYGRAVERQRRRPPTRLNVPVIVVGNLIVGGAGKTPTTIAVVRLLRTAGWTPGVVSRGYGRGDDALRPVHPDTPARDCGDEPLLIQARTGAPVFVGRDRVAAARALLDANRDVDVVVADDGLQHWPLARDVEVVVFDERGAGNGLLLPAGPLREPLPQALPSTSLVLYNADVPTTHLPGWTAQRTLAGAMPLAEWWAGAPPRPLDALRGLDFVAAAGIAAPERFFRMLDARGLDVRRLPLPDHEPYDTLPWPDDADVVVTEKDAVKLHPQRRGCARVWVAALDFRPDPAFDAALLRKLPRP